MSMAQIDRGEILAPQRNAAVSMSEAKLPWVVSLYLFCVLLPIGFQVGPLAMNTLRVLVLIATVPLMTGVLLGRYGRIFAVDWLFALHILWAGVALFVNSPDRALEQVGSVGVEFLGGYAIGRAYIRDRATFILLCKRLALLICLALPFALFETLTGRPHVLEALRKIPMVQTVTIAHQEPRLGLQRVQFTFSHPIHFGLFCSIVMSLTFVGLKGVISDNRRWLMTLVVGLCGFLALSSGALLAIILQLGFFAWAAAFASIKQRWWLLFWLLVVAYIIVDIGSNRTPLMVALEHLTFSAHNAYWRTIIFEWGIANVFGSAEKGIVGSPLFGLGLNDWVRPSFMHSGSMDNFWLVVAVSYGVPGFLLIAAGYVSVLAAMMRLKIEDTAMALCRRAWVFTFLGISFTLCTVHIWGNLYSFFAFIFASGMWMLTAPKLASGNVEEAPIEDVQIRSPPHYTRFPSRI